MTLPSFDQIAGKIRPQSILSKPATALPCCGDPVLDPLERRGATVLATLARPKVPPEAFEVRQTAAIKNLSEHRRLELMILPRLMHRIVEPDFHGGVSDPNHPDVIKVRRLLADAMVEPINGLPIPVAEKILNRMNRLQVQIFREAFGRKAKRDKVAAIIWHGIRILLDEEILTLVEGSSAAEAFMTMLPMFEHVLDNEAQDKSARKQALKFIEYLRGEGFFRP